MTTESAMITFRRAMWELHKHGLYDPQNVREFIKDLGDRPYYDTQAVLLWLGY